MEAIPSALDNAEFAIEEFTIAGGVLFLCL